LIVGIGELLWDMLPNGKQLGGAPANFAYISSLLGGHAVVLSRVGDDELGCEAQERCRKAELDISHVQVDSQRPTGTVRVSLDEHGIPTFTILTEVAWDYLEWSEDLRSVAERADVICFGSLAQRSETSRQTIQRVLRTAREKCLRIFDVNLRQSFFTPTILKTGFALATVVKLNEVELPIVLRNVGLPATGDEPADVKALLEGFGLQLVCLTRGDKGSLLVSKNGVSEHPGFRIKVADTVGAGDAFTAAMAHKLCSGSPLNEINEFANQIAAWVASQPGAMPPPETRASFV
jgi:fructokinase